MLEKKPRDTSMKNALRAAFVLVGAAALGAGCLERPVKPLEPNTSNVFVKAVPTSRIDKIDLLFMIDNSVSMGDKQELLKQAVPNLLRRLIEPDCLDSAGEKVEQEADGTCPAGSKPAFLPIKDIHIATITSALGSHGGSQCAAPTSQIPHANDFARLLPTVREAGALPDPDGTGFLAWRGGGAAERDALLDDFQMHVVGAGQIGCGFEASLESWYRFLVDPNPPKDSQINRVDGVSVRTPERDELLLTQRRQFLRSDSLLAIVMLSDENDCSIADEGIGFSVTSPEEVRYKAASEACDEDPNDPCCHSCHGAPPSGCAASPRCELEKLPAESDRREVRCADQKRRFGMDMLWPVQRYIDALTQREIVDYWDPARPLVQNELFVARGDAGPRDPARVVLAGIVGVPWQDIATPESLSGDELTYLDAQSIPWDVVLGDPKKNTPPSDPLMIESIAPRAGLAAPGSWDNPINGNEQDTSVPYGTDRLPSNDDLQYACVFRLTESIDCTLPENKQACDCSSDEDLAKKKPLCQNGRGAPQEKRQYFAKAYPGTRFLEVLKGIGDKAIVASICPKNPVDSLEPTNPHRGYNPAVDAILGRFTELLAGQCLPTELDINVATGKVACVVVEAAPALGDPTCSRAGREPVSPEVERAVRAELRDRDQCDGSTGVDCGRVEMCGIVQLTEPSDKESCFYDEASEVAGFCYIDPAKGEEAGGRCENGRCENPFVERCRPEERRILRFVGSEEQPIPFGNATVLTACVDG